MKRKGLGIGQKGDGIGTREGWKRVGGKVREGETGDWGREEGGQGECG